MLDGDGSMSMEGIVLDSGPAPSFADDGPSLADMLANLRSDRDTGLDAENDSPTSGPVPSAKPFNLLSDGFFGPQVLPGEDGLLDPVLQRNGDPVTQVDEIVVTGRRWRVADYNPGWYDWDGYDTNQPEPPPWHQDPRPYDACEDRRADTLTSQINAEIASQPDSDRREYGALIWRDDDGNLHRTALRPGANGDVPWPADPAEVGLDSYSRVVGMVHSHPSLVNLGTDAAPNWVAASHGWMHGGDWAAADAWVRMHGLSHENVSMYISYQGQVREYDYRDNLLVPRDELTDRGTVESGDYNPGQACT